MPGIYLRQGETYVAMTESTFKAESDLQALIAQHPEMLSDEDGGQQPLLLVKREAGVNDREDGSSRFSLDHLYLDARGVPTLVEVKRSSDTRGRREVVAQMLDYAANARTSFNAQRMLEWIDEDASARGTTTDALLRDKLGVDDAEAFWQTVDANLKTERFRLIFVSDVIGPELRRIIEFLNGQMTQTDVLAIEVKQYVDDTLTHQTIVPRFIGNTERARIAKRPTTSGKLTRSKLLSTLEASNPKGAQAAERLLDWAEEHPRFSVRWTTGGNIWADRCNGSLLRIQEEGALVFSVHAMRHTDPAWDDDSRIEALLQHLEQIAGVTFTDNRRQWPRIPLAPLAAPSVFEPFLTAVTDVADGLNGETGPTHS